MQFLQDRVRAEVKELFRRNICYTEGGICRGTDVRLSVDDGARKSNNWLDQWQSGKLSTGSRV